MRRARAQGFTLAELVVSIALLAVIFTVVLGLVLSGLKLFRSDQGRTAASSNVRGTMDVLGSDVRQAGENLSSDAPAISVTQDAAGAYTLTVRRGLTGAPLPLCAPPTTTSIEVTGGPSNTSQATFADGSSNLPAACKSDALSLAATATVLGTWQTLIASGLSGGYLYDPLTQNGGFVKLTGTTPSQVQYTGALPANAGIGWNPLSSAQGSAPRDQRLYLMEERTYSLTGSRLQLAVNGGAAGDAAANISTFAVTPYVNSAGTIVAATLPFPNASFAWRSLAYVDVQLASTQPSGFGRSVTRTQTYRLVPRNTASNDR